MKKIIRAVFSRKNFARLTLPILLVVALIIVGFFSLYKPTPKTLTPDQAKQTAETFINKYLMQGGQKATVESVTTKYGLYKMKINIVSSKVESYLTKDGKLFFPQALDINKINNQASGSNSGNNKQATTPTTTVSNKTAKPTVQLFVMSYCPYGTQIEKGILPVLNALGNKIDFKLEFVDYAMHGSKELAENLTQYCISQKQPKKLEGYLSCFLQSGDSASCLKSNGINSNQISSCTAATDQQYKITANAKNHVNYKGNYPSFPIDESDNQKYKVLGSPTLVINGQTIKSGRDSASLLNTICSAFTTEPAACKTALSSATPAPGLATQGSASGSTSSANCGQ